MLITGALIIVPIALLVDGLPSGGGQWRAAGAAALAGVAYFGAFLCLLRGLHGGDLGLISALNALQGAYAVLPCRAAVVSASRRSWAWPSCFASSARCWPRSRVGGKTAKGVPWAIAAGLLFACVMVLYSYAHEISWLSQAAISRSVSVLIAVPAGAAHRRLRSARRLRAAAVGAGALESAASFSPWPWRWARSRWRRSPRRSSARSR